MLKSIRKRINRWLDPSPESQDKVLDCLQHGEMQATEIYSLTGLRLSELYPLLHWLLKKDRIKNRLEHIPGSREKIQYYSLK